jgi:hypothetical protein
MAAAGSHHVQLLGDEDHVVTPAVEAAHRGVLARVPKQFWRNIKLIPAALKTPLFTYDLEANTFVRVEAALDHLSFDRGMLVAVDLAAAYNLALYAAHTGPALQRKHVLQKSGPVCSVKRNEMCALVSARFPGPVALPPAKGVVSVVLGALQFEAVAPGSRANKSQCAVKRCTRDPGPVGGLCVEHAKWSLKVPVPCDGAICARLPFLRDTPWLYTLLGWPGVYFDRGVSPDLSAQRGRLLVGLFFDDVYSIMAKGNKHWGDRCAALARVCVQHWGLATILVRMVETQEVLRFALHQPNATGAAQMVAGLSEWFYACDCLTQERTFPALRISRFLNEPALENTASLLLAEDERENRYVVSSVAACCVKALFTPLTNFTYRVCAGRRVREADFAFVVDAACVAGLVDFARLRQVPSDQQVLVKHAEMLSMGLLLHIAQIAAPVTFQGSLVAACGGFRARATGRHTGFVWHLVVQGARSDNPNGFFDTSGAVDTTDESLRQHCAPSMLVRESEDDVDPLLNLSLALHNNAKASPSAERVVYRNFTLSQATGRYTRRSEKLVALVLSKLPKWS